MENKKIWLVTQENNCFSHNFLFTYSKKQQSPEKEKFKHWVLPPSMKSHLKEIHIFHNKMYLLISVLYKIPSIEQQHCYLCNHH